MLLVILVKFPLTSIELLTHLIQLHPLSLTSVYILKIYGLRYKKMISARDPNDKLLEELIGLHNCSSK